MFDDGFIGLTEDRHIDHATATGERPHYGFLGLIRQGRNAIDLRLDVVQQFFDIPVLHNLNGYLADTFTGYRIDAFDPCQTGHVFLDLAQNSFLNLGRRSTGIDGRN